jgi:NADH dehydrogenase, FAD-containing subunit
MPSGATCTGGQGGALEDECCVAVQALARASADTDLGKVGKRDLELETGVVRAPVQEEAVGLDLERARRLCGAVSEHDREPLVHLVTIEPQDRKGIRVLLQTAAGNYGSTRTGSMARSGERERRGVGAMTDDRFHVVVAGAGVAGLELALALEAIAREYVSVELIAPEPDFTYRPLAVAEPFQAGEVRRFPLDRLAHDAGAELRNGTLVGVDAEAKRACSGMANPSNTTHWCSR